MDSQAHTKDHSPPNQTIPDPMEQLPRLFLATRSCCTHQLSNKYGKPGEAPRESLISVFHGLAVPGMCLPSATPGSLSTTGVCQVSSFPWISSHPGRSWREGMAQTPKLQERITVKGKFLTDFPQTLGPKKKKIVSLLKLPLFGCLFQEDIGGLSSSSGS